MRQTAPLYVLPLLVVLAGPVVAQDAGAKDEDPESLFLWAVKPTDSAIVLECRAPKLPDGTKVRASIQVGDWAVQWKRAYVMKGKFRVAFPRKSYRDNTYQAMVLYQYRGQISELDAKLKKLKFGSPYSRRLTFRLGTEKKAAINRLAECKLMIEALAKLQPHLDKGEELHKENKKLLRSKKYSTKAGRTGYETWIKELKAHCGALQKYSDRHRAQYRPRKVDETLNLFRVAERFGKALYRDELTAMGVKRMPRGWEARGMLSSPPMVKDHIKRNLPPLSDWLAKQVVKDEKAVPSD